MTTKREKIIAEVSKLVSQFGVPELLNGMIEYLDDSTLVTEEHADRLQWDLIMARNNYQGRTDRIRGEVIEIDSFCHYQVRPMRDGSLGIYEYPDECPSMDGVKYTEKDGELIAIVEEHSPVLIAYGPVFVCQFDRSKFKDHIWCGDDFRYGLTVSEDPLEHSDYHRRDFDRDGSQWDPVLKQWLVQE